jgi:hypothetical protein
MTWKPIGELGAAVVASAALLMAAPASATAREPSRDAAAPQGKSLDRAALDRLAQRATDKAPDAKAAPKPTETKPEAERDPREGDAAYEQSKRLMRAVEAVLQDAANNRSDARKLPPRDSFIVPPIWTETREDREAKIKDLLDAALGIVTDVPVVELQKRIETLRKNIRDNEDQIVALKEKKLTAPKDALLPGILTDTVDSLEKKIEDQRKRIEDNRNEIRVTKGQVQTAMEKAGVKMSADQLDLLLDSVLSGDLVRLVAAFTAAKGIDQQLGQLVNENGENLAAARKYFAMHAALFAMLVQGQNMLIEKIDTSYLPKLGAIEKDIKGATEQTRDLMRNSQNRPDQKKALEANLSSQQTAARAADYYRKYLLKQREQLAQSRARAMHDLRIADNTFQTVEASFQLRALMKDSALSFEAIQKLEAPGFEQIFQNEELRREFENLTKKLGAPTS